MTVRDWVRQAHSALEQVTGLDIREIDFTDDRLTIVLRHLAEERRWQGIEQELGEHLVGVAEALLSRPGVTGLLTYRFERQVEQEVKLVGRGRGGANRNFRAVDTTFDRRYIVRVGIAISKMWVTLLVL